MMRFLEISSNRKPAPTQGPKDWRRLPLARPWWGLEPQRKGFKTELGATELGTLARKATRSGMELQDGGDHPNLSQILPSNFLPLCYSLNVYVPIKWVWGDLHHIWWRQFTLMSLCFSCSNFQIMSPPSDLVPEALQEAEMMNIYHTQKISFDYFKSLRHLGVVCFDPTLTWPILTGQCSLWVNSYSWDCVTVSSKVETITSEFLNQYPHQMSLFWATLIVDQKEFDSIFCNSHTLPLASPEFSLGGMVIWVELNNNS